MSEDERKKWIETKASELDRLGITGNDGKTRRFSEDFYTLVGKSLLDPRIGKELTQITEKEPVGIIIQKLIWVVLSTAVYTFLLKISESSDEAPPSPEVADEYTKLVEAYYLYSFDHYKIGPLERANRTLVV